MNIRKNHKFITASRAIKHICQPLEIFKIHLFTYLKKFHDGSQINLSTDENWIDHYYRLSLYDSSMYEATGLNFTSGFQVWPTDSRLKVFQHGREYFKSDYGFTISQKQMDGCEFFFFSLTSINYPMLNFCLNNIDLFEQFIFYFKEKAADLIKECSAHKLIVLPKIQPHTEISSISDDIRTTFINAIDVNPLAGFLKHYKPLSKKEQECLNLLLSKPTVNEVAKAMSISRRTAETHLEHIKNKLHCNSKQELLFKLATYINPKKEINHPY